MNEKFEKILIYAGTTEGRTLAEKLAQRGIKCDVSVATEYGNQVMEESKFIHVMQGRLDFEQMTALYEKNNYDLIIDATHPFAQIVSENIKSSVEKYNETAKEHIILYRLARNVASSFIDDMAGRRTDKNRPFIYEYEDSEECAKALINTKGNILLTTGSKELSVFCAYEELKKRLIVRVLPGMESLSLCYENSLEGRQIIAMQGPFSKEMNISIIHQYDIKNVVTKESGKTGGVDEKIAAAAQTGALVFAIKKPSKKIYDTEYDLEEILKFISQKSSISVILAGIGTGDTSSITENVKNIIQNADLIFGAKRMIDSVHKFIGNDTRVYPYYLAKDIIPVINENAGCDIKAVVLFSGDTGFFSGAKKLQTQLKKLPDVKVSIMPGISSVQALASKTGESWEDAVIISTHGIEREVWMPKIRFHALHSKKIIFITSGGEDIKQIAGIVSDIPDIKMDIGYQLSYNDEKIISLSPQEINDNTIFKQGLYVGMIRNEKAVPRKLSPSFRDEDFIRDKVPMTKEEIRHLSICKLKLAENSVVFDVGCGTGSISIEAAAMSADIKVYAIETNPDAVNLTKENCKKHNLTNVKVIENLAPSGFENLPVPTHVFIGGSKGNLREIMQSLADKKSGMRIVINAVSLETIAEISSIVEDFDIDDFEVTCINVSKAKKIGGYHLMQANNPVYIFSFDLLAGK